MIGKKEKKGMARSFAPLPAPLALSHRYMEDVPIIREGERDRRARVLFYMLRLAVDIVTQMARPAGMLTCGGGAPLASPLRCCPFPRAQGALIVPPSGGLRGGIVCPFSAAKPRLFLGGRIKPPRKGGG